MHHLLALLRSALGTGDPVPAPPAGLEWSAFLLAVERHRVGGLLHRRAGAALASLPPPVAARLATMAHATTRRALQRAAEQVRLLRALEAAGIETLAVKGLALAQRLYGEIGVRHAGDIDLLVRPEAAERADRVLQAEHLSRTQPDFALTPRQLRSFLKIKREFEYVRASTAIRVELLWRLENMEVDDAVWREARPIIIGAQPMRTLPPELDALYQLQHGAKHGWFRLFWLVDAALLLRDPALDWETLLARARARGSAGALLQAAELAERLLHVERPAALRPRAGERAYVAGLAHEACRQIAREPMPDEGVREWSRQLAYRVKLQKSLRGRWHALTPHLFSPESWRTVTLPDRWFFLYPLLSPFLWLRRRTRRFAATMPLTYRPGVVRDPVMYELQTLHNRTVLASLPALPRAALLAADQLLWPVQAAAEAVRLVRREGRAAHAAGGPSSLGQLAAMLRLALVHRWRPADYYYFDFWLRRQARPGDYLPDGRAQGIFLALNAGADLSMLDDKRRFAAFCARHGLPTPPVLAHFHGGQAELLAEPAALERDLFFKLRRGSQARGTARWTYDPAPRTYRHWSRGTKHAREALLILYARLSSRRDYIAQPRLHDHPDLADLGNGSLSTVRMVTAVQPDGSIADVTSVFNLPTRGALINNLADGGLACPVDSATGTLLTGFTGDPGHPRCDHHPFNGARIAGRVLPRWRETVALACAAHAKLPGIVVIGWDIALTPDGPVLLEGNHQIALNFLQLPPSPPLGHTALPALLLWHLRRKLADDAA
ncbi:MAG TPA: nucleotidyltransferase family protein [Opitutaceae bacterium]